MTTTKTLPTAHATSADTDLDAFARDLDVTDAAAIVFFASPAHDAEQLGRALHAAAPTAAVLGCTTAGEFTDQATSVGGIAAAALPHDKVVRAVSTLADFGEGVASGVTDAVRRLEEQLGCALRDLDPSRHVGLVLIDGTHGAEEEVNEVLGLAAPFLSFVGGSAGDDLAFARTTVVVGDTATSHGAALAVLEMAVPFVVTKTCSFAPTGTTFRVTRADTTQRIVWELDGRPATEVYAEAVGVAPHELDAGVFMGAPLGLMIDGEPWIRSPQQTVDGVGIRFYCQILEGIDMDLMRSTDLVGETREAMEQARRELGGQLGGGLLFNCILRRLELDADDAHAAFLRALGPVSACGFHTYGESYIGHINQTLTGLLFA